MSHTPGEPRAESAPLAPAQFGRAQPVLPPPPLYKQQAFQTLSLGGTVVPLPAQDASAPGSQNYLGVLSLVAPFVGFSVFGIVFGHLALKAIKAGRAHNNGIAVAGTVISWVVTSLATLGVLGFIAIVMFAPMHDAAQDAAVQSNLKALQMAASAYEAENAQAPTLTFSNHQYYLGTSVVSAEPSVTAARFYAEGPGAFCIEVDYGNSFVESIDNSGRFSSGC